MRRAGFQRACGGDCFTFAMLTLGCKVNQADGAAQKEQLGRAGGIPVPLASGPDLVVVNTCSVTAESDRKARQLIRRARRIAPGAVVALAGCGVAPRGGLAVSGFLEGLGVGMLVVGAGEDLRERLRKAGFPLREEETAPPPAQVSGPEPEPVARTRENLKVQDGCDQGCSYCIVPLVRGRGRSLPYDQILARARQKEEGGCREIVLTGVNLGAYGAEGGGRPDLPGLLEGLLAATTRVRLRLSSLEPDGLSLALVRLMAEESRICRHLHLPLQHASDAVLARMNRPYTIGGYSRWLRILWETMPDLAVSTDVMAGFPGETELEFSQQYDFLSRHPIARLHVFGFSPRPGTPAADLPDQVRPEERERRVQELLALGSKLACDYRDKFRGHKRQVVLEKRLGPDRWEGLTDNYLRVEVRGQNLTRGRLLWVSLYAGEGGGLRGQESGCRDAEGDPRQSENTDPGLTWERGMNFMATAKKPVAKAATKAAPKAKKAVAKPKQKEM